MNSSQSHVPPALVLIAQTLATEKGKIFAARWLEQQRNMGSPVGPNLHPAPAPTGSLRALKDIPTSNWEVNGLDKSHQQATALLAADREALGAAYETVHFLARWSLEHASEEDPAPHLFTVYWALEEALGKCERTLRRHLVEDGWPWSETVRKYIDVRVNYGTLRLWNKELKIDEVVTRPIGMMIRLFLRGRLSENACVKRFAKRDVITDADQGLTKNSRPEWIQEDLEKDRYQRGESRVSAHTPLREQITQRHWLMVQLGRLTVPRVKQTQDSGKLCADISTSYLLDALREDLRIIENHAIERGAAVPRARSLWVDRAASVLAERFDEHRARKCHQSDRHITHADGFTNLWRRILWTAIKAELYGGTQRGWMLMHHLIEIATEMRLELDKPTAYAWLKVKPELEALRRDFGISGAGEGIKA